MRLYEVKISIAEGDDSVPFMTHINLRDKDGCVYCCLRNKVVKLDESQMEQFCRQCKMFAGTAGGQGVECVWDDMRAAPDPLTVADPRAEFAINQRRKLGWSTAPKPAMPPSPHSEAE